MIELDDAAFDRRLHALWQEACAELPAADRDALRRRRRAALGAPARAPRTRQHLLPLAAAASIALASLWVWQPWTAALDPGADPAERALLAQAESSDLYENLDFYLWLAASDAADAQP